MSVCFDISNSTFESSLCCPPKFVRKKEDNQINHKVHSVLPANKNVGSISVLLNAGYVASYLSTLNECGYWLLLCVSDNVIFLWVCVCLCHHGKCLCMERFLSLSYLHSCAKMQSSKGAIGPPLYALRHNMGSQLPFFLYLTPQFKCSCLEYSLWYFTFISFQLMGVWLSRAKSTEIDSIVHKY